MREARQANLPEQHERYVRKLEEELRDARNAASDVQTDIDQITLSIEQGTRDLESAEKLAVALVAVSKIRHEDFPRVQMVLEAAS